MLHRYQVIPSSTSDFYFSHDVKDLERDKVIAAFESEYLANEYVKLIEDKNDIQ